MSLLHKHSWYKQLGDVADFIMGQAPPGSASNFDGKGTIFVKAGEFGNLFPVVREWTSNPLKFARKGDVLICVVGATAGKLNLGIDCAIGRSVAAIRPFESIVSDRFIYHQLQTKVLELRANSTGSAQGVISRDMLKKIKIFLPPLPQQHCIVAEIEKQFSRLEEGVSALKRVQANLKRYRAAVLKAACEGKLVENEVKSQKLKGKSVESGEQLLKRILEERRKKWQGRGKYKEPTGPNTTNLPQLPEGWTWATMPQLGELNRGKSKHRPRDDERLYGDEYPFIQTGDVRKSNGTIREYNQCYSEFGLSQSRLWPEGTLCITIAANIAETGILKFKSCFPDSVVGFTHNEPITTRYLEFFIRTAKEKLAQFAPATAQKNINLDVLQKVAIPLPPLAEQKRIVEEVERRLSVVEELESLVTTNLQRATRLRQSILQKAFEGDLV